MRYRRICAYMGCKVIASTVAGVQRIPIVVGMRSLITAAEQTRPSTAGDAWDANPAKVPITIVANGEEEAQSIIEACETPAEAWKILKDHYKEERGRTCLAYY